MVSTGPPVNQREIYYRLKARGEARSERDIKTGLLDLVSILNVPRDALGVTSSGKGLVAGALLLHISGKSEDGCSWSFQNALSFLVNKRYHSSRQSPPLTLIHSLLVVN